MNKIIHYENEELEIQGYKEIISVSRISTVISFQNSTLYIYGHDLNLSYFSGEEIAIKGCIESIKIDYEEKRPLRD